jgi:ankyrin repeat protein
MSTNEKVTEESRELFAAAEAGDLKKVTALLQQDSTPNWQNRGQRGATALHVAVINKHTAVAKLLMDNGAELDRKMFTDLNTPLHRAAMNGDEELVKICIEK